VLVIGSVAAVWLGFSGSFAAGNVRADGIPVSGLLKFSC
jgi:hypothetical protein